MSPFAARKITMRLENSFAKLLVGLKAMLISHRATELPAMPQGQRKIISTTEAAAGNIGRNRRRMGSMCSQGSHRGSERVLRDEIVRIEGQGTAY